MKRSWIKKKYSRLQLCLCLKRIKNNIEVRSLKLWDMVMKHQPNPSKLFLHE